MSSPIYAADSLKEICENVKNLGYSPGKRIRLYGEYFEVLSDPFPEADGIAVNVKLAKNAQVRVVRLPATVLGAVKRRLPKAA